MWCFVSCFLSRAPYISFTMFWSVIVCAYYYLLCTKIKDWSPVKKTIQAIFLFVILLVVMQLSGKDSLLNFGLTKPAIVGTIGNPMIFSSFMCILSPLLLFNPLNWVALVIMALISHSAGAILSICAGIATYTFVKFKRYRWGIIILAILIPITYASYTGKFQKSVLVAGRGPVWIKTAQLSLQHPFGYGIGTYKILFPHLCGEAITKQQPGREWNNSHNDWLQILFEAGFPGVILFWGWLITIVRKVNNPI